MSALQSLKTGGAKAYCPHSFNKHLLKAYPGTHRNMWMPWGDEGVEFRAGSQNGMERGEVRTEG